MVYGGGGNDTVYGGRGNDILRGGHGNDRLYGGGSPAPTRRSTRSRTSFLSSSEEPLLAEGRQELGLERLLAAAQRRGLVIEVGRGRWRGWHFPGTVADQLSWLAAAGFYARPSWQHRDLAVVVANRPEELATLWTSAT